MLLLFKNFSFPAITLFLLIFALIPNPISAEKSSAVYVSKFKDFAFFTIASAIGCSLSFSALAQIFKNSFSSNFLSRTIMSVTSGSPYVIVPVLSSTIVSALCKTSSASADFISIPFSAAFPVPTIIATGVAKPSAQGHDITRTAIAFDNANSKL